MVRSAPRSVAPAHHIMKEVNPILTENLRLGKPMLNGLQYDSQQSGLSLTQAQAQYSCIDFTHFWIRNSTDLISLLVLLFLLGRPSGTEHKAPSFQIGLGRNLAGWFFGVVFSISLFKLRLPNVLTYLLTY